MPETPSFSHMNGIRTRQHRSMSDEICTRLQRALSTFETNYSPMAKSRKCHFSHWLIRLDSYWHDGPVIVIHACKASLEFYSILTLTGLPLVWIALYLLHSYLKVMILLCFFFYFCMRIGQFLLVWQLLLHRAFFCIYVCGSVSKAHFFMLVGLIYLGIRLRAAVWLYPPCFLHFGVDGDMRTCPWGHQTSVCLSQSLK